ncbi:hypothetical protein [Streptomyces sp. NPDC051211]|uniref:hypothetical protein n=1 Tax=Streptomyces sp. NPDC051211 TaxID=3154643 RepID=UPI00344FBCA3
MIGEPELDDSSEFPERPQERADAGEAGEAGGPVGAGEHRARPAWQWALAGAVAASALWAGGLALVPEREGAPPIAYGIPTQLCDKVEVAALTRITGDLRPQRRDNERLHEAVDLAWCGLGNSSTPEQEAGSEPYLEYDVTVTLELHKKADPAVEFDAGLEAAPYEGTAATEVSEVVGVAERALMYGSGPRRGPRLKVLDGGAVITLQTNWSMSGNDLGEGVEFPPEPDEQALQAAMIEDMRALLAALRK